MEEGEGETRAEKAARIRPELFRLLLEFDPPEKERSKRDQIAVQAKGALQREIQADQAAASLRRPRVTRCEGSRGT